MAQEDVSKPSNTDSRTEQRAAGQSGAHLLRLVPLLGLGWQVLGLRREVRRLWLLVVIRLLALLAVTAHTLLSILRWHLSKSQAKKARKSESAIQWIQIWFPFSDAKWLLCQATEFSIFNVVSLTKTDALPSVHVLSIKSKDNLTLLKKKITFYHIDNHTKIQRREKKLLILTLKNSLCEESQSSTMSIHTDTTLKMKTHSNGPRSLTNIL